jgi:paraquat-inducible protein B
MSRKANPTLVGAFILGAAALAVAGVAIFGSGSFLRAQPRVVAYFEGNVRGLNVGAPVNLRGVPIGQVTEIKLDLNMETLHTYIPVYMEINPGAVHRIGSGPTGEPLLKEAVQRGLRAQLAAQSFVTGQLLVELDMYPNTPARMAGLDKSTPEIPTIKSDIEHLKDVLGRLPLENLVASVARTFDQLNTILSSPEIPAILASAAAGSEDAHQLVAALRADREPLIALVTNILKGTDEATVMLRGTLAEMRGPIQAAEAAMRRADRTLASTDGILAPNSPQRADLNEILRNLAGASRSIRSLADQLDRKPNALVIGR